MRLGSNCSPLNPRFADVHLTPFDLGAHFSHWVSLARDVHLKRISGSVILRIQGARSSAGMGSGPVALRLWLLLADLSMGGYGGQGVAAPSSFDLDPNLLQPSTSAMPFPPLLISDMDKSLMAYIAANTMDELLRLLQTNEPLWTRSSVTGKDVLDLKTYQRIFPKATNYLKEHNVHMEASRDSGVVIMNGAALVDMLVDPNRWAELFPSIVSMARTIEVVSSGVLGSQNGSWQLMYEELQVLSPLVPIREFYILRYCQQIEQGLWAVVNVSYDIPQALCH